MAIDKVKSEKLRAVKTALRQLEKTTKKEGIAYVLGEKEYTPVPAISSGSLMLDIALGVGGIPRGRIVEFFGAESSGKTLLAIKTAAECQKSGGLVAFVDMEQTFDRTFAAKLGLNVDEVILSQPDHLQDAFNVIDALIGAGVDLIILDSVAALVPQEELEGEIGKQTIALVARYMSQFLRRIGPKTAHNGSTVIFINQTRDAVGVMYGNPVTTPGGKALKFYSSVRVEVAKVGGSAVMSKIGGEDLQVGHSIRAKVVKNKVAPPFRKAEFQVFYDGREVDKIAELAQVAILKGLIPKYDAAGNLSPTGRNYKWPSEPNFLAKKKDDVADELRKYPRVQEELIDILKGTTEDSSIQYNQQDLDSDLSEEEFEEKMNAEIDSIGKDSNEAEETEDSWNNV
jgi:recombination protein RecA